MSAASRMFLLKSHHCLFQIGNDLAADQTIDVSKIVVNNWHKYNRVLLSFQESPIQVPTVTNLEQLCDGTALAALISFYCPEALPRSAVKVGRMASIQDCLHNLMLVYEFCQNALPHNVFHMLPEDVTYMRG